MNETTILPVMLCGYETSSLIRKEKTRIESENKMRGSSRIEKNTFWRGSLTLFFPKDY
jgi:hypothetical protein